MIDNGTGYGHVPYEFDIFERAGIIERYEERRRKGQGGTHEGTRNPERKPKHNA